MSTLKNTIRELCIFLHLDLTKNLEYDRLTRQIMRKVLTINSSCIDVGCHKGEILDLMLRYSPEGKHFAFEPIPFLYKNLEIKYAKKASIYPYALSDQTGETSFQFVKNAPAYSGIKQRSYKVAEPDIEEINVSLKKLDDVIPNDQPIDFIKIDVEGAEYGVMKGAAHLLKKHKPTILFECGMGASDYYDTDPAKLYDFLTIEIGLKIYTLKHFIKGQPKLETLEFVSCFNQNTEYYFIATK